MSGANVEGVITTLHASGLNPAGYVFNGWEVISDREAVVVFWTSRRKLPGRRVRVAGLCRVQDALKHRYDTMLTGQHYIDGGPIVVRVSAQKEPAIEAVERVAVLV